MKYIIFVLSFCTLAFNSLSAQSIFIDLVNNDCPEPDILTVCLGDNDSYTGQYRYKTYDHFCGEEITGTTRIYRNQQGEYFFDDFSFGTWPSCYGIDGPTGTLRFNVNCSSILGISGTDNYGDVWGTEDVSYSDTSFIIKWFNSYPEFGTTELIPLDGRPIGEPGADLGSDYSIKWSTGDTSQTIFVIEPGRYAVDVTSSTGDVFSDFINVPEDTSAFDPLCNGEIIEVSYFLDKNANAVLDGDETLIPTGEKYMQLSPLPIHQGNEKQFHERYVVEPGRYHFIGLHQNLAMSNPNLFVDVFPNAGIVPAAIGLVPDNLVSLADVHISSLNPERCNRVVPFRITIKNTGTTPYDDQVTIYKDPLMSFVSAGPEPSDVSEYHIAWDVSLAEHGDKETISLLLKMPGGEYTGELFCLSPSSGNYLKSYSDYCFPLRCAYDPNDKHGTPFRGDRNLCLFEEELKYTIRFENLGNDTAFDVRIEDRLHEGFDISSYKLLQSSHEVTRHYIDMNRVLHIYFDNIMLPSIEQDTIANKGFVQFEIKTEETLPEESDINNTARIYFDFNDPVVTNQTVHTFVTEFPTTSTKELLGEYMLTLWPNPSNDILNLRSLNSGFSPDSYQIIDPRGRTISSGKILKGAVSLQQLEAGYYFIRVIDVGGLESTIAGFIKL